MCYPPVYGRLPTRYSPVRHSVNFFSASSKLAASILVNSVRLACVKHAASVHPEPGSNSHVVCLFCVRLLMGFSGGARTGCWILFKRHRQDMDNEAGSACELPCSVTQTCLVQSSQMSSSFSFFSRCLLSFGLFSEFSFLEFSGLHCCLFVKVLCYKAYLVTLENYQTEKEGFEPSRRY